MMIGEGFIGTPALQVTTANQEIITLMDGDKKFFSLYRFSFSNDKDCVVVVNGKHEFLIKAGQGFSTEYGDAPIFSFVVKTAGVNYNYIGGYGK